MKVPKSARKYLWLAVLLGPVFWLDLISYEVSVGPLYLLIVAYARWQMGLKTSLFASMACALLWALADYGAGHRFSHRWMLLENTGVRLFTYIMVVAAVSIYQRALEAHRRRLAMLERLLSVCPGCGAICVNQPGWHPSSEFHRDSPRVYTLCPTCAATHPSDAPANPPRAANR